MMRVSWKARKQLNLTRDVCIICLVLYNEEKRRCSRTKLQRKTSEGKKNTLHVLVLIYLPRPSRAICQSTSRLR